MLPDSPAAGGIPAYAPPISPAPSTTAESAHAAGVVPVAPDTPFPSQPPVTPPLDLGSPNATTGIPPAPPEYAPVAHPEAAAAYSTPPSAGPLLPGPGVPLLPPTTEGADPTGANPDGAPPATLAAVGATAAPDAGARLAPGVSGIIIGFGLALLGLVVAVVVYLLNAPVLVYLVAALLVLLGLTRGIQSLVRVNRKPKP